MDKVNAGNYVPQCNLFLITQKLRVNSAVTTQKLFKYKYGNKEGVYIKNI